MSRIILTKNDLIDIPLPGRANVYVKADGTLALRDSDNNEFIFADTRKDMTKVQRRLMTGRTRITAAQAAGLYWFSEQATLASAGLVSPLSGVYIDTDDFPTIAGVAPKIQVRAQLYTNDVAPGSTFVLGLYPVTRPATSGGAGLLIYTPGTIVTGSAITFTTPAADAMAALSVEFALPPTGHYAIGFTSSAAIATNAHVHMQYQMNVHN